MNAITHGRGRLTTLTLFLLVVCFSSPSATMAQSVDAQISSMEMLVGEQVAITVTAHAPDTVAVEFPDTLLLPSAIEVIEALQEPAVSEGNGMSRHVCNYIITSFTDTIYPIPPIQVKIGNEKYPTQQLALEVLTVDVDTTNNYQNFHGMKDIIEQSYSWKDDENYKAFGAGWIVVILFVILIILGLLLNSNKPIISRIRIVKRTPPHLKALKAIDEIKAEKMTVSEDQKEYYTRLTDTLRQYMFERYHFNAMEMTSSEIIDNIMKTADPKSLDELRQLFTTADLVKFAKYTTHINENDANLLNAVDFINQTKQENVPTEEIIKPELTVKQQQSRKMRWVLISLIAVTSAAIIGLIVYIGWFIHDMLV